MLSVCVGLAAVVTTTTMTMPTTRNTLAATASASILHFILWFLMPKIVMKLSPKSFRFCCYCCCSRVHPVASICNCDFFLLCERKQDLLKYVLTQYTHTECGETIRVNAATHKMMSRRLITGIFVWIYIHFGFACEQFAFVTTAKYACENGLQKSKTVCEVLPN